MELEDGEPVLVAHTNKRDTQWYPRVFKEMRNGKYVTYWEGNEDGFVWEYCKKWKEAEE